ncbi:vesicle transport protein SFT2A isoform X4 [Macaca fascicularis]|uniref:vesicle transport protein SFT2A isoform X4 n=1 Tax=Macaca fascicularis TaxID=9541 RepID=UPI003D153CF6
MEKLRRVLSGQDDEEQGLTTQVQNLKTVIAKSLELLPPPELIPSLRNPLQPSLLSLHPPPRLWTAATKAITTTEVSSMTEVVIPAKTTSTTATKVSGGPSTSLAG